MYKKIVGVLLLLILVFSTKALILASNNEQQVTMEIRISDTDIELFQEYIFDERMIILSDGRLITSYALLEKLNAGYNLSGTYYRKHIINIYGSDSLSESEILNHIINYLWED